MAPFLTHYRLHKSFGLLKVLLSTKKNQTESTKMSVNAATLFFLQNDKCDIDVWEGLKHPVSYCNALEIAYMYSAPNLSSPFTIFKIGSTYF